MAKNKIYTVVKATPVSEVLEYILPASILNLKKGIAIYRLMFGK